MKKISLLLTSLMLLFMVAPTTSNATSEVTGNTEYKEDYTTYESESIDWENITSIIVAYLDGDLSADPFLKDAKDRKIPIIYDENFDFSAIRTRIAYFSHFSSISWISRSGNMSLSVMPKNPYTIDKENAWREILRFIQYHPIYTEIKNSSKQSSTYNQFVCHADYARGFKTPWNLEPWKPDKGYWGFVKNRCN